MIKILFICHGNICRSPMAEFIFKKMLRERNLEKDFFVASAATSSEEIWNGVGNPVYPPARRKLEEQGINCDGKRAVQLRRSDYAAYDYLLGMDGMNIRNMERICGKDLEHKMYKLLSFAGKDRDIADPWYTGNFDLTYEDIVEGCEAFLKFLGYE